MSKRRTRDHGHVRHKILINRRRQKRLILQDLVYSMNRKVLLFCFCKVVSLQLQGINLTDDCPKYRNGKVSFVLTAKDVVLTCFPLLLLNKTRFQFQKCPSDLLLAERKSNTYNLTLR